MKNILIIGGAGYIGTIISEYLYKKNYNITIIDNLLYRNDQIISNFFKKYPEIRFINKDICKINNYDDIFQNIDGVILLAGLVGDPITKKYPDLSIKINRDASKFLINSVAKNEIKKFIFVSTCSNYGLIKDNELADENFILNPLSLYAKLKVEIEKYILKTNFKNTCPTILRFATAFGYSHRMRLDLTINEFIYEMHYNKKLLVYDPDTWRPYCHVIDFARLIEKVFDSENTLVKNQVFNAGIDKNNYTKRQLVNLISKYIDGCEIKFQEKGSDPRNYKVNFSKLKNTLNFQAQYIVDESIENLIHKIKETNFSDKSNYGNYFIN